MPGNIIYEGRSLIDRKPIFVAAIWGSKNSKTGALLQTYIMRSDMDPRDANKSGEDRSICGGCQHRGIAHDDPAFKLAKQRSCYVNMGQGPLIVYRSYKAGKYPLATGASAVRQTGAGRLIRLGTYGDPGAVPRRVWDNLLHAAKGHTAYTHNGADPSFAMVSADSLEQAQQAWASKYRTFRVVRSLDEVVRKSETVCPASAEAGYKAQCSDCMLCGGTSVKAKSVAIVAHGSGAAHF